MGPRMFVFPLWPVGSVSHQKEEDRREGYCDKIKVNPGEG